MRQLRKRSDKTSAMDSMITTMLLLLSTTSLVIFTNAATKKPIPAPDIPTQCNNVERCCMPTPYTGTPGIRHFDFLPDQPWRVRRPAHLLSDSELARLEKAYKLMRALPDSDPRSLLNQKNLHCLYCDNALYYPGQEYPLEIHNGWYFLPWHRMFMFWHERILAKLLDDDTFALPFWAWDNQQDTDPPANVIPRQYTDPSSSLYDPVRNNCSRANPYVDLDNKGGLCSNKTAEFMRVQNDRLGYSQLVIGAPTAALFFGMPYYFGDYGGGGPGTFEDQPHGTVHAWVGDPYARPPLRSLDDMGNFGRSAYDPVFYAHHANVDRVWLLWRRIPGGARTFPMAPAFNQSQFTFYDENANLVKMNVSQVLDSDLLRYKYESLPAPWITNGVEPGQENSIPLCNPLSETEISTLITNTPKFNHKFQLNITKPLTFRVKRPPKRPTGTEVLELSGLQIPNATAQAHWKAYLFFPQVQLENGAACPEYAGTFNFVPHLGQASYNPKRVWRVAVGPKLQQLRKHHVKSIVVTMVQTGKPPGQTLSFAKAKILYDMSS